MTTVILILILLVGLSLLLYPTVSNWWNSEVQSRAVASYDTAVNELTNTEYETYFEAARAYNEALYKLGSPSALARPELLEGYNETLDITGTGIMGYVTIDKLNVQLPVYHGTSAAVLSAGAGHLEGTSLPVGGENTHSVISAHRGLPSAKLFTNLDKLEEGDTFTVTVLDKVLTYRVDQIRIVLPDEVEDLYIQDGEDHCTLLTCTPYGINTHRMMVRGVRIDHPETQHIRVTAEAVKINSILVAPFLAIPLLIILLIWLLVSTRRKAERASTHLQAEQRERISDDVSSDGT